MSDRHTREYDYFDLQVIKDDDGRVDIDFRRDGDTVLRMDFDTLRDVIDFVGVHGLGMKGVWLNERDAEDDELDWHGGVAVAAPMKEEETR